MGSTNRYREDAHRSQDHPHIHGEHTLNSWRHTLTMGSPPYTWGAPNYNYFPSFTNGITPIYMGSTFVITCSSILARDHPHIHGEHYRVRPTYARLLGSPPYTWGAQVCHIVTSFDVRITPIYMGSTELPYYSSFKIRDHPHIHGEHWPF